MIKKHLFDKCKVGDVMTPADIDSMEAGAYSFCETVFASSSSPWHIRPLTAKGKKLGGGADTVALCGRVVAWDLNVKMTGFHLSHNACKACLATLKAAKAKG